MAHTLRHNDTSGDQFLQSQRRNGQRHKTHSQNGNPSKINPEKVEIFRARKTTVNAPAFHQQPTTNSPPKYHVLHPVFAKTPSKNGVHRTRKNYCKSVPSSGWIF